MFVFYHVCALPESDWADVVTRQAELMESSGLLSRAEKVCVGFLGQNRKQLDFLLQRDEKYEMVAFSTNLGNYERLTLNALRRFAMKRANNEKVFYWHTKGITHGDCEGVAVWTFIMEHFLITNHEECVDLLDHHDTVGIMAWNSGNMNHHLTNEPHAVMYSGNFWWANTAYLKTLPKIPDEPSNLKHENMYWLTERWLLHNIHLCRSKHLSLWQSPITTHQHLYAVKAVEFKGFHRWKKKRELLYRYGRLYVLDLPE